MNNTISAVVRSVVSITILSAGVGGFLWMGTPEVPTQDPRPEPPPLVETQAAIKHTEGISFDVDGVVVPFREIAVAAQVAGKVEFKADACRSGRTVTKGELLLRIEDDDYQLEVRRLKEELAQADAMILELDAELTSSANQIASFEEQLVIDARQLKRSQELMSRSAASDTEVDAARKSELTTRNSLQSLVDQKNLLTQRRIRMESAKALVQANLEKAELDLKRTEVFSPIDGVVVSENVEQDGYIQPGGTMVVLQDTAQLDVTCKLYMRQMHWLWQGVAPDASAEDFKGGYDFPATPATVIYALGDEQYSWDAVVDRYDGAGLDSQTRMVPCRVHVENPTAVKKLDPGEAADANSQAAEIVAAKRTNQPPTLMTGMFVKVRIHASPPIPLVRLPQAAIQPGNTVWTVEDGKLQRKSIAIANSMPQEVVAYQRSGGLQAGDLVVTSPLATPVEGMAVSTSADASKRSSSNRGPRNAAEQGKPVGQSSAGNPSAGGPAR